MLGSIVSSNAGEAAFSRFSTTNTWPAAQTFSVAATFSAAFASTGGATFTSSATATPSASFRSQGTISAIPTGSNNIAAQFITAQAATGFIQMESSGAVNYLQFRRRNGTYAVPTAIANNDRIGTVSWAGQWGTSVGNIASEDANLYVYATEAFTSTARGTGFVFETTTTGTTTLATRLTLSSGSATFSVPVITSSNFQVSAAAGTTRDIFWRTSGSTRFTASINAVAESGSNAGSNFELRRFSDAGADLGLVMAVTRSTGNITFNGGGGTTTFSANQIAVSTAQTPASATATGTTGTICWDASYIYVCTATNTWKRVAIATWP